MSVKTFRSRWTPDQVTALRSVLPIDSFSEDSLSAPYQLPRGLFTTVTHDGLEYIDLRGFPLAILFNLHDAAIDFSGAKSPQNSHGVDSGISAGDVVLDHCLFDDVQTIQSLMGNFTSCAFRRARMREAYLTAHFDRCMFDEANLRAARLWHSTFIRCSFVKADLLKSEMGGATFDQCDFRGARFGSGSILGTKFYACNLTNVDLADSFRDEETLFDHRCSMEGLQFKLVTKMFGDEIDVGPPPTQKLPV